MILDLYLNHIYSKTNVYKRKFYRMGKESKVWFPNQAVNKALMSVGDYSQILSNSRIQCYMQKNLPTPHIYIGNHCYLGYYLTILAAADVVIEDWVLMASHIMISTENHGINPESELAYMEQPLTAKSVRIGEGSWIGEKVCILPGVTIGKKCIIGASSVVTKTIPDYCIAVGNPAKVIKKYNFEKHQWDRVEYND